jgi:serine/threonine protein kinase/tetratricopeptide (TPR) repeat protein
MAGADRHLLFGLIALQNGLIDQVALVAAFQAWTRDKARPLADHLVARGDLDPDDRALLEALAAKHIKMHGGDPAKSLASVPVGHSTREALERVGDAEIQNTIAYVGRAVPAEPDTDADAGRTATYSVGTATSDGQRFRVLRPHAQGGLGAVFVALDAELNREVALKQILERHADDPTSRQRFLVEAEITGGLEHPGIVPVYGLGTYGGGRPYYAMRFIRGDSLKEAIERFHADDVRAAGVSSSRPRSSPPAPDRGVASSTPATRGSSRELGLRRLLRRFTDVCNAIEYAHSRGVLHRDIKPGNVIVGKHGETLVVDWGLAKPLGKVEPSADSGERTLVPSSASGSAETLPGSALGTPAYMSPEQAAGDLDRLGPRSDVYSLGATLYCLLTGRAPFEGDVGEVLRKVQRGHFPPPRQLDPSIDRALEAVCLKAMATRPEDRYPSCKALAEDVERWAADEPVTAWREPFSRRARRWARRNRTAVSTAAVALVAGVVGLSAVAALQARSNAALTKANGETRRALAETRAAQNATAAALGLSEESRKQAEAVGDFLVDALKKPDPSADGKDVKVADVLDQAAAGLEKGFSGSKATEGALLDALGKSYSGLGLPQKAEAAHRKARAAREKALGPSHRETLRSATRHAGALWGVGRRADGLAMLAETRDRQEALLGFDDPDTLETREELGWRYAQSGRAVEAIALLQPIVAARESKLGPDHRDTLTSRNNLAVAYHNAGRRADAIALHEGTLKLRASKLGPDHPDTLNSRNNLGEAYRVADRSADAARMQEGTLKLLEAKLGPDHPNTLSSRNNLGEAYRAAGRSADALALHEGTLKLMESKLGPDHPNTISSRNNLALTYGSVGRTADAIAVHEGTLKLAESKLGPDHPGTLTSRYNLGTAYRAAGRRAEAVRMFEATLPAARRVFGPDHPSTLVITNNLGLAYELRGRWAEAETLRRDVLAQRRKTDPSNKPLLASDLALLGLTLLKQSKWLEAEPVLRECLTIRANAMPDEWLRFKTMSLLGEALLGQGRYTEAEPLVVPGYEGMKVREAKIPTASKVRLNEAAEGVVRLYEAWGKPEQARAWASKLGLADLPADVFAR